MVSRLKASMGHDGQTRKLVIAYVDIGEAEDWRWYWTWSTEWEPGQPFPGDWPDFIVGADPDGWVGNYPVAYWDEAWQDIMIYGQNTGTDPSRDYVSAVDELIIDGFDGIYLDWVEAFEDASVIQAAQAEGVDPEQEMIQFISDIRTYARQRNPDFLVIQQNAGALSEGRPSLYTVIDAIAQEEIWFGGVATDDWNDPDGYDLPIDATLTAEYLSHLSRFEQAGLPVFCCEYALANADTGYANAAANNIIPYCTRRSLSQLTTTPPPGY
jgi:cysteinyl-tRNA synthetase